jgi:hypothetical protein
MGLRNNVAGSTMIMIMKIIRISWDEHMYLKQLNFVRRKIVFADGSINLMDLKRENREL